MDHGAWHDRSTEWCSDEVAFARACQICRPARMVMKPLKWVRLAMCVAAGFAMGSPRADTASVCVENFDDVSALSGHGWIEQNNSESLGTSTWFQGLPSRFVAESGPPESYISADDHNASGSFPVISNWLITPELTFVPGNTLGFHTRELDDIGEAANRLQVRLCIDDPATDCTVVGPASCDVDGFFADLADINVDEQAHGYPAAWTQYTIAPAMGLPESGGGRIAFRYYNLAQSDGTWGTTIGIDTLSLTSSGPCAFGDNDVIFDDGFE